MDANVYLTPFLNVVHSEATSGPITGAALSSIYNLLIYDFLRTLPLARAKQPKQKQQQQLQLQLQHNAPMIHEIFIDWFALAFGLVVRSMHRARYDRCRYGHGCDCRCRHALSLRSHGQ